MDGDANGYGLGLGDINALAGEAAGGGVAASEVDVASDAADNRQGSLDPASAAKARAGAVARRRPGDPGPDYALCVKARIDEIRLRLEHIGDPFAARQAAADARIRVVADFKAKLAAMQEEARPRIIAAEDQERREQDRAQWVAEEKQLLEMELQRLVAAVDGDISSAKALQYSERMAEGISLARTRAAAVV